MTPAARVADVSEACTACRHVRENQDALRSFRAAEADLECRLPRRRLLALADGGHARAGRRVREKAAPEARDGFFLSLHLEKDPTAVVQDPSAESLVGREAVDERTEADPLDGPLDLDPQPLPHATRD